MSTQWYRNVISAHLTANNIYVKSTTDEFVMVKDKIAKLISKYNGIIPDQLLKYTNKVH